MLLATIKDVRVIIIKLADKLHNMRTIMFLPEHKQTRISQEALDIYAPLAGRLGMSKIRSEIEDLAFHVLHHEEYHEIASKVVQRKQEIEDYIENIRSTIHEKLYDLDINAEITGRAKHYYSIYRKMKHQDKSFEDIFDIRAIRIITNEIKDCYAILGTIHTLWTPIALRFKDFIAVPKSNMYQSLHTTVIGPDGHRLEIQIRTWDMHATAEMGIAAHWLYKEKPRNRAQDYKNLTILKNLDKLQKETNTREFMKELKMDLYEDENIRLHTKGEDHQARERFHSHRLRLCDPLGDREPLHRHKGEQQPCPPEDRASERRHCGGPHKQEGTSFGIMAEVCKVIQCAV